jgi:Flp pilus assembly protein TadB
VTLGWPTWLLLAAAFALAGRPRRTAREEQPGARQHRPQLSPRALESIAALASVVACLAVLGIGRGAVAAVVVAPAVIVVVRRAQARPSRPTTAPALPLALDLIAVALRAGQPVDTALITVAPAAGDLAGELLRVGRLLRLGADPVDAWDAVADVPALAAVAAAARRSATSGIRLAATLEAVAAQLRADQRAAGEARAHRVGVLAAAPLGLCFLPSFVCLGIVPALIGLAAHVLR